MKQTTEVWIKLESVGYPDQTVVECGTVKEVLLSAFKWALAPGLYLNSQIRITMAKSREGLSRAKELAATKTPSELESIFEQMMLSEQQSAEEES